MSSATLKQPTWTLGGRWVFPVSGPPIADGLITIRRELIVDVEPRKQRRPDVDLGDVAILPGLVNAHTHLDLFGLRGQCPPGPDFTAWLRRVIQHRRTMTPEKIESDVRAGLAESLRCGTTLLGDISAAGASWPILVDAPLRSVIFYELLGLTRPRATQAIQAARSWLAEHPATANCRPGLSPHAPYSVCYHLFVDAALEARDRKIPLAVHLAESREELELLRHQTGPFVPFLQELNVWDAEGLVRTPTDVLDICNMGMPTLYIHCNYLAATVKPRPISSVVYCPRTHAAFGHRPYPLQRLLAHGVPIALGTDSLASNPDLSVLAELRFIHRHYPDVRGDVLLRMATLAGAEALGWSDETGSLVSGKSADLIIVPIPSTSLKDPYKPLLESDSPVSQVLCRGQWIKET
jgi:cytosine/adenosine deaminase-related metal-dependent hydrolase